MARMPSVCPSIMASIAVAYLDSWAMLTYSVSNPWVVARTPNVIPARPASMASVLRLVSVVPLPFAMW